MGLLWYSPFPGVVSTMGFCPRAQLIGIPTADLAPDHLGLGGKAEAEAALGCLNSFPNGTPLCLGGAVEQVLEGGVPGFIKERRPHCVLLLEQVPERPQCNSLDLAKRPYLKVIAQN